MNTLYFSGATGSDEIRVTHLLKSATGHLCSFGAWYTDGRSAHDQPIGFGKCGSTSPPTLVPFPYERIVGIVVFDNGSSPLSGFGFIHEDGSCLC